MVQILSSPVLKHYSSILLDGPAEEASADQGLASEEQQPDYAGTEDQ